MFNALLAAAITVMTAATGAAHQAGQSAAAGAEQAVRLLVEAQRSFDVRQIDAVLAPDYVEISPVGEVDPRAKVLSFYAPDQKVADAPAVALDELATRVYGDTAITIARVTFSMKGPDGAAASRSMRCVFVTRSIDRRWQVVSAQYTPMRK